MINLHMNFGCHMNFCYLSCLLERNPLLHTSHLHISRFVPAHLISLSFDIQLQSKDCPAGRGGGEVGCGKDASPQKSKGVLLGHRLPLVYEEHERRSEKGEHGPNLPINPIRHIVKLSLDTIYSIGKSKSQKS